MKGIPSLIPRIDSSLDPADSDVAVQAPPAQAPTSEPVTDATPAPASTPTPPQNESVTEPENPVDQSPKVEQPAGDTDSEADAGTTPPADDTVSFNLQIMDFAGDAIAGLKYKVIVGKTEYNGVTDAKGLGEEINGLKAHEPLEILVLKADGEYSSKYKGFTDCADMNVCAVSPHIKVPVTTDRHEGEPAPAPVAPTPSPTPAAPVATAPAKSAPPAPLAPPAPGKGQIESGGKGASKQTTECRNTSGHPTATLSDRILDWAQRHRIPTFNFWNWHFFSPDAKGCTEPAVKDKATADAATGGKQSSSSSAPAPASTATSTGAQATTVKVASATQSAPKAVTDLISIMEEQTHWEWDRMFRVDKLGSASIYTGLLNKTLTPATTKPTSKSDGRCYPSVKIGLMRTGLATGMKNTDEYAKHGGDWLKTQGYINILGTIPDARWALPGDIIVYQYPDATEQANKKKIEGAKKQYDLDLANYQLHKASFDKEVSDWNAEIARRKLEKEEAIKNKRKYNAGTVPKKPSLPPMPTEPKDGNWGHIDVRTYDGYISDFKTRRLPMADKLIVIGIWRKVFDPLPDLRLRAFLKVLREWECHGEANDSKRYYMLPGKGTFTDTRTHPFEGKETKYGTPSGAYQIILKNYVGFLKGGYGLEPGFTPLHQDRMAVLLLEVAPAGNALAEIRQGNIEKAVDIAKETWASLPGGTQPRREDGKTFNMADVLRRYNDFLNEQITK